MCGLRGGAFVGFGVEVASKTPEGCGSAVRREDTSTAECRSQPMGGGWPERPEVAGVFSDRSPRVWGRGSKQETLCVPSAAGGLRAARLFEPEVLQSKAAKPLGVGVRPNRGAEATNKTPNGCVHSAGVAGRSPRQRRPASSPRRLRPAFGVEAASKIPNGCAAPPLRRPPDSAESEIFWGEVEREAEWRLETCMSVPQDAARE